MADKSSADLPPAPCADWVGKSLGVLELTALAQHQERVLGRGGPETDTLLVWGGDASIYAADAGVRVGNLRRRCANGPTWG